MPRYRRATKSFAAILLLTILAACARFLSSPPQDYSAGYANDVFEFVLPDDVDLVGVPIVADTLGTAEQ